MIGNRLQMNVHRAGRYYKKIGYCTEFAHIQQYDIDSLQFESEFGNSCS